MKPEVLANFPAFLVACGEGDVDYLYLDQGRPPNVTIGKGNLLPSLAAAQALGWLRPDKSPATAAEVQQAWATVLLHPELAPDGGEAFARLTTIRATRASLDALLSAKVASFDAFCRREWPGFEDAPWQAEEALLRIVYACGPGKANRVHWPKLWAAWCAQDWYGCSTQCAMPGLNGVEPRANDLEAALFRACVAPERAT